MRKPAIKRNLIWSVMLILLLACGCAPYRLEVGPQFGRDDDQERFKSRVEAVLAERLKNTSGAESGPTRVGTGVPDREQKGDAAPTQPTASPSAAARASQVSWPSPAGASEASADADFRGARQQPAPRSGADSRSTTSAPARLPPVPNELPLGRPGDQISGSVPESPLTELDRELQLLRDEREACRQELLTKLPTPDAPRAADADVPSNAAESSRQQLHELMSRLAAEGLKRKTKPTGARPLPQTGTGPRPTASPLVPFTRSPANSVGILRTPPNPTAAGAEDPLAAGKSLFAAGDYEGALKALRGIDLNRLNPANRGLARYLTASCLRKQGRWKEAEAEFSALAKAPGDATLADNARWQLEAMRWQVKLEDQLAKMRQASAAPPKSP
jgi:tetratricopeptide (TPR) repeat protein